MEPEEKTLPKKKNPKNYNIPRPPKVIPAEPGSDLHAILSEKLPYERQNMRKLSEEQQLEMIKLIAQGLTASQIADKMFNYYGIEISFQLIYQYKRTDKWKKKLKELKAYYRAHIDDIPGSNKHVRIRRMEEVLDKANRMGDLRVVVAANEQIKKEFEKEGGDINIFHNNPVYQQFNSLSNEELLIRQKEATRLLMERKQDGPDRSSEGEIPEHEESPED